MEPVVCADGMTFEDCELAVLRHAVDENQKLRGEKLVNQMEIKIMISVVESFLKRKQLLCYGGTAINNILPKSAQFYDYAKDVPDYDFFSSSALADAKELADAYAAKGYANVEAKAGMHHGTYKVFVNFIPMADVTQIHPHLFKTLREKSIDIDDILYVPADFLRMSMYLELSRPEGDISRWEKVLKRLILLNKHHPVKKPASCNKTIFQRPLDFRVDKSKQIFETVRDAFAEEGVVFFGGYASALYSRYMPTKRRRLVEKNPDFDVLHEDPARCASTIRDRLAHIVDVDSVKIVSHAAIGELIPESVELKIGRDTIAFLYKPIACHNYNILSVGKQKFRVATIDTILSFYLAFLFMDQPIFAAFRNRHLCLVNFLFELEQKNRLAQTGLLRRFTASCYGKQETLESIRAQKAAKFASLKIDRDSKEYQEWFLNYQPTAGQTRRRRRQQRTRRQETYWNPLL